MRLVIENGEGTDGVNCPKCGEPWVVFFDDDVDMPEGCPHLRFIVPPEGEWPVDVRFRNGMTADALEGEILANFRRLNPDDSDVAADDLFHSVRSDADFWEQAQMGDVDTVVSHEVQEGIGRCFVTLFGAKLEG
jgi:hypothetical protein